MLVRWQTMRFLILGAADSGDPDVLSFFFVIGAGMFVTFGFLDFVRPPKLLQDDYSKTLGTMARYIWPLGLGILIVSGLVWLYGLLT